MNIDRQLIDFAGDFLDGGTGFLGWLLDHWVLLAVALIALGIALDWLVWVMRFSRGERGHALLMRLIGHDARPSTGRGAAPRKRKVKAPRKMPIIASQPAPEIANIETGDAWAERTGAKPKPVNDHAITEAMREDAVGDSLYAVPRAFRPIEAAPREDGALPAAMPPPAPTPAATAPIPATPVRSSTAPVPMAAPAKPTPTPLPPMPTRIPREPATRIMPRAEPISRSSRNARLLPVKVSVASVRALRAQKHKKDTVS